MAWRNARSLVTLRAEVARVAPGTTFWTIGDSIHQAEPSDHNPNAAGVVCAADVLGNAGLDLRWFVDTITAADPPALKYVIYEQRIWFPGVGWHQHRGQFHDHAHVSVGRGPDGRSTGPYDDTSPWGLLEEDDVQLTDTITRPRDGKKVSVGVTLAYAENKAHMLLGEVAKVLAIQKATHAIVAGQDPDVAFRAALAEHRAELGDDVADRVADRLGDQPVSQDQFRRVLREELGRTRLVVETPD